jgi:hypothetical protein
MPEHATKQGHMIPERSSQNRAAISATKRNLNLIRTNSSKGAYLLPCSWSGVVDREFLPRTCAETGVPARLASVGPHDGGAAVHPDACGLRTQPDRTGGGRARSYQIHAGSPAGPRATSIRIGTRLSIQAERSRRHLGRCRRRRGEELPDGPPHRRRSCRSSNPIASPPSCRIRAAGRSGVILIPLAAGTLAQSKVRPVIAAIGLQSGRGRVGRM